MDDNEILDAKESSAAVSDSAPGYLPESSENSKRMPGNRLVVLLLGVIAALLVVIVMLSVLLARDGGSVVDAKEAPALAEEPAVETNLFEDAMSACGVSDVAEGMGAHLADEGSTLLLDGQGKEDSYGLLHQLQECVLLETGMPDSIKSRLGSTRALDGTQNASWESIEATWTYHPNAGLDIILTLK